MPLIIIVVALFPLKYFEVWKFAELAWWHVIGAAVFAFVWFEVIEPMFGLDKKKAHDVDEERRKERIRKNFDIKK
jgi:small Trp-rich protein